MSHPTTIRINPTTVNAIQGLNRKRPYPREIRPPRKNTIRISKANLNFPTRDDKNKTNEFNLLITKHKAPQIVQLSRVHYVWSLKLIIQTVI